MAKSLFARITSVVLILALAIANPLPPAAKAAPQDCTIHVDAAAPSGGDGLNWGTAYQDLQTALAATSAGCQVWVAAGTYAPASGTTSTEQAISFQLKNGVNIYGGFAGGETALSARNIAANPTTLTGIIGFTLVPPFRLIPVHSYHVVAANSVDGSARLDGFSISMGDAGAINQNGGGMYSSNSSPALVNLIFTSNNGYEAGGLYVTHGSPTLVNVSFTGNTATWYGGMEAINSSLVVTNGVFANNTATSEGGGFGVQSSSSVALYNTTFYGNTAPTGNAIYNDLSSSLVINNSILWGSSGLVANDHSSATTTTINDSDVQGGCPVTRPGYGTMTCTNVINQDPAFVDAADEDFHLGLTSPVIDAGNNNLLPQDTLDIDYNGDANEAVPLDRDRNVRRVDIATVADTGVGSAPVVDMGAFEARDRIYVSQTAAGLNNGSNWSDAYTDLQSGLASAISGSQIWVAKGTYKPTRGTDRTISFSLKDGVAVYGGFAGTETSLNRAYYANLTYLSGDLLGDDTANFGKNADNSYHVVTASGVDNTAILDGLRIVAGNANGGSSDNNGAGLLILGGAGPYLNNVVISYNIAAGQGGGVYSTGSAPYFHWLNIQNNQAQSGGGMASTSGSPVMVSMFFTWNIATQSGGGLYSSGSNSTINGASFSFNQASSGMGGAMANINSSPTVVTSSFAYSHAANGAAVYNFNSAPVITSSTFNQNSATNQGGVLFNDASSPTLTNVTLANNTATVGGGGLFNQNGSHPVIANSILWNDKTVEVANNNNASDKPAISYSLVQGCNPGGTWNNSCGLSGGGNLADADPQFANLLNGNNLRVMSISPTIDAGSDTLIAGQATDLVGDPRLSGLHVDLGAYELTRYYVDTRAKGANDGSSWANAFTSLQSGLAISNYDAEIWVAKGVYKPTATTDRTLSFNLQTGHMVFGGFDGTEMSFSQRDFRANQTILSGDLKGDDGPNFTNTTDNSYTVVSDTYSDNTPILDGFTITGGNGSLPTSQGGGVRTSSTSPTLSNLLITGNNSTNGGGIAISYMGPALTNVVITANAAANGGGMYLSRGMPMVENTIISANHASVKGGGVYAEYTDGANLVNVTMTGNSAGSGSGLYLSNGAVISLTNDIFWGDAPSEVTADQSGGATNLAINHSLVNGCYPGGAWNPSCQHDTGFNLADTDPQFADPLTGNLSLRKTSPAINQGNNVAINNLLITTDLAGNPRILDGTVDLGAYEYINLPPVLSDSNKLVTMDSDITFSQADFASNFKDSNGDDLVSVTITVMPSHGTLYLGSSPVTLNQVIAAGALDGLYFTPAKSYIGMDSFAWNASDGALSAAKPATVVINLLGSQQFIPLVKVK